MVPLLEGAQSAAIDWQSRSWTICACQRSDQSYAIPCATNQESMETKTEILETIQLALPPTATMAQLQKEVEKKMGWEPTSKLER